MSEPVELFPTPLKYAVESDSPMEWYVVDTGNGKRHRYPIKYRTREQAEAFMDRLNAAHEGEPVSVIEDLRRDADALRGQP